MAWEWDPVVALKYGHGGYIGFISSIFLYSENGG